MMDSERVRESMKTCNCFTVSHGYVYIGNFRHFCHLLFCFHSIARNCSISFRCFSIISVFVSLFPFLIKLFMSFLIFLVQFHLCVVYHAFSLEANVFSIIHWLLLEFIISSDNLRFIFIFHLVHLCKSVCHEFY